MFILTECKNCGLVWSTMKLASECERIDRRREEMKTEDQANIDKIMGRIHKPISDSAHSVK